MIASCILILMRVMSLSPHPTFHCRSMSDPSFRGLPFAVVVEQLDVHAVVDVRRIRIFFCEGMLGAGFYRDLDGCASLG